MVFRWFATLVGFLMAAASTTAVQAKPAFTTYGDVAQYALPAGAALLTLIEGDRDGLKQFAVSSALTIGTTYGLKYSVDERRPDGGAHSFPSAHTSFAFAGAAFVHERYGWEWGIPAELAAAAVAYSRVDAGRHHWYDVLASAGIAHASAFLLVDHRDQNVTLLPLVGGRKPTFGIVAAWRF